MVQRRAEKNPPPDPLYAYFVLDLAAEGFGDEQGAQQGEKHLLLQQDRHHSHCAADGKRSGISHKDLGRIGIIPQKAEACPHECRPEDRQFAGPAQKRIIEIAGVNPVALHVGEDAQHGHYENRGHDGKPVETVGYVHGVGNEDHEQEYKQAVEPRTKVDERILVKWNEDFGGKRASEGRVRPDANPGENKAEKTLQK